MGIRETIQERAEQGGFGPGFGLVAIGNRVGRAIPSDIRSNVRENTDSPVLEAGTRIRDGVEYTFQRTPGGQAADTGSDAVDDILEDIREALPSGNVVKLLTVLAGVLVASVALGQLFNVNVGGGS